MKDNFNNNSNNFFEEQRRFYDAQEQQRQKSQSNPQKKEKTDDLQGNQFEASLNVESQTQTFKNLANYYNKNGEDKLIADIFASVKAQKANGTLTNEQLIKFAKSVYPMLNSHQREKIKELLPQLLDT